jgi:hypothetical protein
MGRGGLVAVAFALIVVVGSAAPALADPCNKKDAGKVPAKCDSGDPDPDPDPTPDPGPGNGNGNAYGYGNGNANGHDVDATEGGGGTDGSQGAAGSPASGTGSSQESSPNDQTGDAEGSDGDRTGGSRRKSVRSASAPSAALPARLGSVVAEAPAARGGADLATGAGPQPISSNATVAQVVEVRDRRYWATALTTAETLAFPMSLSLLVVVFLFVQAYIDRDDPKLRQAALKREVYEFS